MKLLIFVGLVQLISAASQHCHSGTGRCYWISDAAKGDWAAGREACQSEGGDLAVMETEELFNYVLGAVRYDNLVSKRPIT